MTMPNRYDWNGKLSDCEARLVAAIERGEPFWPENDDWGDAPPTISAALIRQILLGLPVPRGSRLRKALGAEEPVAITPLGIRVEPPVADAGSWHERPRLRIAGKLVLAGATGSGGAALPPLRLEYCEFEEPVDLLGTRLAALSLRGSRFRALRLSDAVIESSLNLANCGPRPHAIIGTDGVSRDQRAYWPFSGRLFEQDKLPDAYRRVDDKAVLLPPDARLESCVVMLGQALIAGHCDLSGSDFVRDPGLQSPFEANVELPFAVGLAGARIEGSVHMACSTCIGGFNLVSCEIQEDIWITSTRLIAWPDGRAEALTLQFAKVGGGVALNKLDPMLASRFPAVGERLDFGAGCIVGGISLMSLSAGLVWLSGCVLKGPVLGNGMKLAQGLHLGGFGSVRDEASAVAASSYIDLTGSTMDSLDLWGFTCPQGQASVDRLLHCDRVEQHRFGLRIPEGTIPFLLLKLENISVRLAARCGNARLQALAHPDLVDSTALDFYKAEIGRGLIIDSGIELQGALRLTRARIGNAVKIEAVRIAGLRTRAAAQDGTPSHAPTAVDLSGATIEGDVAISAGAITGRISAEGARVSGDLVLGPDPDRGSNQLPLQLNVPLFTMDQSESGNGELCPQIVPPRMIDFSGAKIGGSLVVTGLSWKSHAMAAPYGSSEKWLGQFLLPHGNYTAFRLACFPNAVILEREWEGASTRVLFHDGDGAFFHPLNGLSYVFRLYRQRNDRALWLGSDQARREYLAFFCDNLFASAQVERDGQKVSIGSAFALITALDPDQLIPEPAGEASPDQIEAELAGNRPGAFMERGWNGRDGWVYDATVCYQAQIFNVRFKIGHDGSIEMLHDVVIGRLKAAAIDEAGPLRPTQRVAGVTFYSFDRALSATAAQQALERLRQAIAAHPRAAVELEHLHCASLHDSFGRAWGLDQMPVHLHLAGITCGGVEPVAFASRTDLKLANAKNAQTGNGQALLGGVVADAATSRKQWLRNQFVARSRADQPSRNWLARAINRLVPQLWQRGQGVNEEHFIPQSWETFASAHIRAGDVQAGRDLVVERRDAEAILRSRGLRQKFWSRKSLAVTVPVAAAALAAVGWLAHSKGLPPGELLLQNPMALAVTLIGGGVLSLLALPLLSLMADRFFRAGFRYGLSAQRALATFALMLILGSLGTHLARTGTPVSLRTDWDALMVKADAPAKGRELREDIALVLLAGYSANDSPATAQAVSSAQAQPSKPGSLVYAVAAPCNLGVSSVLYAADVFIPILDLDQESRCTIREEPEAKRSYTGWRAAKVVYEVLGWIVTSLMILTITGVMRRDLER